MKKLFLYRHITAALLLSFIVLPSWAKCERTSSLKAGDSYSAQIPFGKVNLFNTYFYPVGSLLGSVVVPPTNYTSTGASPSTVLWTCDTADAGSLYFLVATNGDDRVGGFYDLGAANGLPDVYATYFAYVGIRQTMSGVTLKRRWQSVPIPSYSKSGGKINIRLQDIPPLQAELYRISKLPGTDAKTHYCGNNDKSGIVYGSTAGDSYTCKQPNAYIELVGPGIKHDEIGEDSAYNYKFHGANNGIGYGMRLANTLYNTPTCVARSATPLVLLPIITVSQLKAGETSSAPFNVTIECSNSMKSGTGNGQTALGFQVSAGAYNAAKTLKLVNSRNGVSMLLSDNYTDSSMAKGVGIAIAYGNAPGTALNLIGQSGLNVLTDTGANAGWYPVKNNAQLMESSISGYTNYNYNFIATLKPIPGQTISTGKVRATATVQVKIQ